MKDRLAGHNEGGRRRCERELSGGRESSGRLEGREGLQGGNQPVVELLHEAAAEPGMVQFVIPRLPQLMPRSKGQKASSLPSRRPIEGLSLGGAHRKELL